MTLKTTNIKGKEYVEVNERLKYFRSNYPNFSLISEVVEKTPSSILIKATIFNEEDRPVATGLAEEKEGSTYINKTSYVENCETSAWGRALGNFGIGIDSQVASYDEVANAILNQDKPKKPRSLKVLGVKDAPTVILNIKRKLDNGETWGDIVNELELQYKVTEEQITKLKTQANA